MTEGEAFLFALVVGIALGIGVMPAYRWLLAWASSLTAMHR